MSFTVTNKLGLIKLVASGIVGIGTGKVVGQVLKSHVTSTTIIDKVTITAASWVISGIATNATKNYTNQMIDDIAEVATEVFTKAKNRNKLERINKGETTFETEGLNGADYRLDDATNKWVLAEDAKTDA